MAFDFPASPVENQIYTPAGGPSYVWRSPAWRINNPSLGADTRRNRIVNPAMQISQENGNTAGTIAGHYADQFQTSFTTTGTITSQRVQSVTPNGSKDRYRVTITVADTSLTGSEALLLATNLEGVRIADFRYGTASAKQVILRFGFKAPAGVYSISIMNNTVNRAYLANFTISAGQANTDTEQTFIIPGDVTGTWSTDTTRGMIIYICMATAAAGVGVAGWQAGYLFGTSSNTNGMASAGTVFELFDVGLYLDAANSGVAPRWETPDEADELLACKRYYWKSSSQFMIYNGSVPSGGVGAAVSVPFPVQMRTAPAVTVPSAGASNSGTAAAGTISFEGCVASATSVAAGAFYNFVFCYASARM